MIVLAAAIGYAVLAYALNFLEGMYPSLKETFLRGYASAQEQLNAIPDDQITVDEYYTRELVNIVSADDLNERIGELKDLVNFKLVYQMNQSDAGNLLTTEEQAKYSALNKEYNIYISNGGDGSQKYVDAIKNNQIKQ
jgi:hypothetical protein